MRQTAQLLCFLLSFRVGSASTSWVVSSARVQPESIKKVHVVQSCHLDVGFADYGVGIINEYFDHHFPLAIATARALVLPPTT